MGGRKRFQSSTVGMDAVLVGTPPPLKVIWGMSGSLVVEQNRIPSNRKKIGRDLLPSIPGLFATFTHRWDLLTLGHCRCYQLYPCLILMKDTREIIFSSRLRAICE